MTRSVKNVDRTRSFWRVAALAKFDPGSI